MSYIVNKNNWKWSLCTTEVLAIVITILVSESSFRFVEKTIMKYCKNLLKNSTDQKILRD